MKCYKKCTKFFLVAYIAFFAITTSAIAADLPDYFLTDLVKAKAEAAAKNKKVLAVFSASWCGPCQSMIKKIYPLPKVKKELANYICVYVDGDKEKELTKTYKIPGFPTFVILDKDANEIGRVVGGKLNPDAFLAAIKNSVSAKAEGKKAAEMLDKEIKDSPTVEAYLKRALYRNSKKDTRGSIADYKEAIKLDKEDKFQIQGNILFLEYLLTKIDKKASIICLKKIIKNYPKCAHVPDAQLELMGIYESLNQQDKAVEIGNVFLEKYPDHPEAQMIQGYIMMQQLKLQMGTQKNL